MDDSPIPSNWLSYAVAGVAGAVAIGSMVGSDALALIPSLYGLEGTVEAHAPIGWGIHLVHGAVFAVVFAILVERLGVDEGSWLAITGLGLVYAFLLWGVGWSIVGPAWLEAAVDFFGSGEPTFDAAALVGHLVYGLAIGPGLAGFRAVWGREPSTPSKPTD